MRSVQDTRRRNVTQRVVDRLRWRRLSAWRARLVAPELHKAECLRDVPAGVPQKESNAAQQVPSQLVVRGVHSKGTQRRQEAGRASVKVEEATEKSAEQRQTLSDESGNIQSGHPTFTTTTGRPGLPCQVHQFVSPFLFP